ncbi:glutathione peroxidase [Lactobacillus corticis]|uniref:Glutathione peroxidase n=1 Tax=Lactobacillus corticis TaxID=2201249 RepID=A0A916VJA3_9LACO|nr:glutathione peroxidase [Lactobacillus corticis]GFZ27509.1 glutathione peroxidase [Lactobacillus corticis]
MGIYDYTIPTPTGKPYSLAQDKDKVLLIVNTATECRFTPQYKDLENIYEKYHKAGLEIIDITCNQFAGQTPGDDEEIEEFCKGEYHTKFNQMKKSDVNGEHELPLYTYLKSQRPFIGFGSGPGAMRMAIMLRKYDPDYRHNNKIKWNFTKFLIDRNGNVVDRFEPNFKMSQVEEAIKEIL